MEIGEEGIREILEGIGLALVRKNHVMRRPDGSAEREVDLVFTYGNHTFVIEVSSNAQPDARRTKRRRLGEWRTGDLLARLSAELGIPATNAAHVVYFDLAGHASVDPAVHDWGVVLGGTHLEMLLDEDADGLAAFLYWNGL